MFSSQQIFKTFYGRVFLFFVPRNTMNNKWYTNGPSSRVNNFYLYKFQRYNAAFFDPVSVPGEDPKPTPQNQAPRPSPNSGWAKNMCSVEEQKQVENNVQKSRQNKINKIENFHKHNEFVIAVKREHYTGVFAPDDKVACILGKVMADQLGRKVPVYSGGSRLLTSPPNQSQTSGHKPVTNQKPIRDPPLCRRVKEWFHSGLYFVSVMDQL